MKLSLACESLSAMRRSLPLVALVALAAMAGGCAVDEELGTTQQRVIEQTETSFAVTGAVLDGEEHAFSIELPDGAIGVVVEMSGGNDADLYTAVGDLPSDARFDCRPFRQGSEETCIHLTADGNLGVMVRGYAPGVSDYLITVLWGISTSP